MSIFVYDIKSGSETQLEVAKAAVKRLKTLKHPSILTYLDSLESDKVLYLATEYVEPLSSHLESLTLPGPQKDGYIACGIFHITVSIFETLSIREILFIGTFQRALSFLNNDGNLKHNNVNIWSIFVTTSGEWKLGGVEYVGNAQDSSVPIKIIPSLEIYDPPEKSDPNKLRQSTKWYNITRLKLELNKLNLIFSSADMWGLGCLIWEVFNGPLQKQSSLKELAKVKLTSLYVLEILYIFFRYQNN